MSIPILVLKPTATPTVVHPPSPYDANFYYDGDGNWVMSIVEGVAMVHLGDYYEYEAGTGASKSYYGGRVAMRVEPGSGGEGEPGSTGVFFLLSDHLGNTNLTIDSAGNVIGEMRYSAWGEIRFASGTTPTDFNYTGQRQEPDLGFYYYKARWYDPALGRFMQADSVVPHPASPQSLNRYAYVMNNPLGYIDPTGKKDVSLDPRGGGGWCEDENGDWICDNNTSGWCLIGPSPVPTIPESSLGGDLATPWDVGWEWLTGKGGRHHEFREGDYFTELLQQHNHIEDVRFKIADQLGIHDCSSGEGDYWLGGLEGIPKYIHDYSNILTFGHTGNLAVTYLGSYDLDYYIVSVDPNAGTAEVLFHVRNESTLASATHPPLIGYSEFWLENIEPFVNSLVPSGPVSITTQSFWWTETIQFK